MKISYKWLKTHFERSLFSRGLPSPHKTAELLTSHAFEVEGMEMTGDDFALDVKVLPDRAHYALCHRGIAREIGAITDRKLLRRARKDAPFSDAVGKVDVRIDDPKLCRRYAARRIEGISVSDSPKATRSMLEAIGARAINSIVDITNFVMYDIGQPIHAFDADKLKGGIRVRLAGAGENIVLLDDREVSLSDSDLVIADEAGPIAIAGVKGGKRAEVTSDTRNIIVESANFDPVSVRRTSTRHNLRNDSSKRFENELTPYLVYEALDRVTKMAMEVSPKSKAGPVTDIYPAPVSEWTIECSADNMRKLLGLDLGDSEIASVLERLDFRVVSNAGKLIVTPPLDRLDVRIEEEVADEVGRIYGFEKIPLTELPEIARTPIDKAFYWTERAKNILSSCGFSEVLLYSLVPKGAFEIAYPLASDKAALRESIAPKLSESLAANGRNADLLGREEIKIFEIGEIFPKTGERTSLCIGASLVKKKKGASVEAILNEAIKALEDGLGVKIEARVSLTPAGALAEIDFDSVISRMSSPGPLSDLGFKALPADKKYKPFSPFPYIVRDVAFFAPKGVSEGEALSVVGDALRISAKGLLVKGPDIFDKFEKGDNRSYALRFVLQSFERTLSDEEANEISGVVYKAIKDKGWVPR